jgi:O-antigen biosynthesis protein WbqP
MDLRIKEGVDKLVPGITGWAQINGRDELSIPDKVKLEVEYMKRKSLLFDVKILWLTIVKALSQDRVSH